MKTTTDGNVDVKRPDEVELLREALNDLSDLPNGLASGLLDLLNKKDDRHRAASIRELIEEFARRISSTPFSFGSVQAHFEYSVLLWLRHRAPIFPVVLYLQGGEGLTDEEYQVSLFGRELFRFRYASVGLAHLLAEEYLESGPLGVALLF